MVSCPLNPQQMRLVHEYLMDTNERPNGKQAAIRAGYTIKSAKEQASKILNDPRAKKIIEEHNNKAMDRIGITKDRILQELALLAFSNPKGYLTKDEDGNDVIDWHGISKDNAAPLLLEISVTKKKGKEAIKTIKIKSAEKVAALQLLGKHKGMFKEQVEHSGSLTLEQLVADSMKAEDNE